MKVKLDENFGTSIQKIFTNTGHDIHTVLDQGIKGCSDETLYDVCCSEQRCLVTLDLDFADITLGARDLLRQEQGRILSLCPEHQPEKEILRKIGFQSLEVT